MALMFARLLDVPKDNIVPVGAPKPGDTPRPRDCHLSTKSLEALGVQVQAEKSFEDWWTSYFASQSN
jgi:S-adenosylmethionine synthetase